MRSQSVLCGLDRKVLDVFVLRRYLCAVTEHTYVKTFQIVTCLPLYTGDQIIKNHKSDMTHSSNLRHVIYI